MPTEISDEPQGSAPDSIPGFAGPSACCGGKWITGMLALSTIMAIGAAAYFAGQASVQPAVAVNEDNPAAAFKFPPIDATAAVSSEKFSMATGLISDRAEGVFVLDHNSGLLQCAVMYPRLNKFMGLFTVNVGVALESGGKGGQYIMTTGLADFPSSSSRPAAGSVIYVLDTSTGVYACYGIPFDRVAMNAGRPQQGGLVFIAKGNANPIMERDAGR